MPLIINYKIRSRMFWPEKFGNLCDFTGLFDDSAHFVRFMHFEQSRRGIQEVIFESQEEITAAQAAAITEQFKGVRHEVQI